MGGRLLRPHKQGSVPVEAKLDEEMGELEDHVRPDDLKNFAATVSSHSDEEIFRHLLDSDVGKVIFPLGQTRIGLPCYEDLAHCPASAVGDRARLQFARAPCLRKVCLVI